MADDKTKFPKFKYRNVATPVGVARYTFVHKADDYQDKRTFHTEIVFDGDADLSAVRACAIEVAKEVYPGRAESKVNILIKVGDDAEKDGQPIPELQGKHYIRASCQESHPPQIIGRDRKPLTAGTQVRSGDLIKLILSPQPSTTPVKGTITFRLMAVMLVEKRSGGSAGDFGSLFGDDDDSYGGSSTDGEASSGVDAGAAADDDDFPF